jgi:hypothetical protein
LKSFTFAGCFIEKPIHDKPAMKTDFIQQLRSAFAGKTINLTIGILLLVVVSTIATQGRYAKPGKVIEWDIISYYAYLPAVFIHQDLNFEFRENNIEKYGEMIWPVRSPIGKNTIITSMGMAFLYAPFFFLGHIFALLGPWEADGYSIPYRFALSFSVFFYLIPGLIFLSKILRRYFDEKVTAFTLIAVLLGTNLLYYSTDEGPMSHAYNFALITLFIWSTIKFYDKPSLIKIILTGALAGLIALIRPTNILVLILFFLWDIRNWDNFRQRFSFFLKRYYWVIIMAVAFILVWVPQMIYWHWATGQIFFFSYGLKHDRFYFDNPQIFNILFSYKKGWFVYTPIMLFAIAGLFKLPGKLKGLILPFTIFTVLNVYILSSWWSWWFGGGFGLRSFIDMYGLMAIPLAAFTSFAFQQKRIRKFLLTGLLSALILFNLFQTWQYRKGLIHWELMNKEAYWANFLRTKYGPNYWDAVKREEVKHYELYILPLEKQD